MNEVKLSGILEEVTEQSAPKAITSQSRTWRTDILSAWAKRHGVRLASLKRKSAAVQQA